MNVPDNNGVSSRFSSQAL